MFTSFYFTKQPREETTISVDFSSIREVLAGEIIVSATVEITLSGLPVNGMLVSHTMSGARVLVRVRGGEGGKEYKISILVITNTGHIREADVTMMVWEQ